jgi:hypothetical protein
MSSVTLSPGWWRDRRGRPCEVLRSEVSRRAPRWLGIAGDRMPAAWMDDGIMECSFGSSEDIIARWSGPLPPLGMLLHIECCDALRGGACECGLDDHGDATPGIDR